MYQSNYYYKMFRQSCVVRFMFGEVLLTYYNDWFMRKSSVRCQVQGGNLNSSFVVEGMAIARRLDSQTPRKLVDGFESGLGIQRWFCFEKISVPSRFHQT